MPTTYLWQQRLLNKPIDDNAGEAVRNFTESGKMDALLCEVRTCGKDVQRMVDTIRRCLNTLPAEHRRIVALHIHRASFGSGAFSLAAVSALCYVH